MNKYKLLFYMTVIATLFLSLYIQTKNKKIVMKEINYYNTLEGIHSFIDNVTSHYHNKFKHEGLVLEETIFEDDAGNEIYLEEFLNENRSKLLIHMIKPDCSTCYDSIYIILNEFLNSHTKEEIMLFSTTMNHSDIYNFYDKTEISIPIYKISNKSLENFYLPKINILYMFLIDERKEVNLFFSPILELPQITNDYLKMICNRYINEKVECSCFIFEQQ